MKKKEKKQKPKYNMWQNSGYMISLAWREREKKVLVLGLLSAMLPVAVNLLNLYVMPTILSAIERRVSLGKLLSLVLVFSGLLMVCTAAKTYVDKNILFGRIQVRMAVVSALNRKAATTAYPNVAEERFRKLCAKANEATGGNSAATEAVWTTLEAFTKNVLGFLAYLLVLSSVDLWIVMLVAVTTLLSYLISRRLNEYYYRHREEIAGYENQMWYIHRRTKDYRAAKDIRIFGLKPWLEELDAKAMASYMAFHKKANGISLWGRIADLLLTLVRNGVAYGYLLYLVLEKSLGAAEFLLYFSAVEGFAAWVSGILGELSNLHRQSLDLSTVRECLEYPEPFALEGGERLVPEKGKPYEIKLVDVSFRYPESAAFTLEHINLTLRPGEKLAVVGLNGAGKTTLVKLICGFFDPTEGQVLLNGRDVRAYNRRDYYRLFSAVFQSFSLLAGTVALNIAQTEEGVDLDRVRACARQAGLLKKLEALPEGFETPLNRRVYEDALELSGGETQRLMLARALYKDAPILLLDEPTAALDPLAEEELYQAYHEMTAGKSSIYISHRLASTRFCDRIVLLEENHIAEEGTHRELLEAGGRYAELFEVQGKYYREEVAADEA